MATLKIYNDIAGRRRKIMLQNWGGQGRRKAIRTSTSIHQFNTSEDEMTPLTFVFTAVAV